MAVPKKGTSKSKTRKRKYAWKSKAIQKSLNAFSLANLQKRLVTSTKEND